MRKFMKLTEALTVVDETYSRDNSDLLRYMKSGEFDPYSAWYQVAKWLEDNDYLDVLSDLTGEEIHSAGDLHELEPDVFFRLPKDVQDECAEHVVDVLMRDDPAEAPTWKHLDLNQNKLLPRRTWLVHFSNGAAEIARNGFKYGVQDMTKLGLTKWTSDDDFSKAHGGYNFAFRVFQGRGTEVNGDAKLNASNNKYGRHAVLFQNSGVFAHHGGDEEDQVMFWGPGVDPKGIILLYNDGGDWCVKARHSLPNGKDVLFKGEFDDAVKWVVKNRDQYRRYI